jgi:PIN domain nuclease of toxin-antitoxin system
VLDTCAMIAFFSKEKGAEKVKEILENAALSKCSVLMHSASVAELYYDTLKTSSIEAESMIMNLKTYPITFIENITTELIKQIVFLKQTIKYLLLIVLFYLLLKSMLQWL